MGTTLGPGAGYTTARVIVDRHSSTATISGDQTDPELSAARQFASVGNTTEAMRLVAPYVARYVDGAPRNDMEAIGVAYILIRSGQTESLFPWALELWRSERLAADGLIIAAEWFGQAGCHLTALNLLRQMAETGLPVFTDGYSLAVARLAAYGTRELRPRRDASARRPDDRRAALPGKSEAAPGIEACAHVARSLGQELREWDRRQARAAHERIVRGIAQVDWSAYLIRLALRPNRALPHLLRTGFEWLETRLMSDWTRIAWRVHGPGETEQKPRSAT
jgi:hypothetical protein